MNYKNILLTCTSIPFAIAPTISTAQNEPATSDLPNILCILVDDLGYGDLSCQEAEDLQTPNIDEIFKQGITFNQFYANCPVSSPSRASLLTGRYPDMAGVPGVIRQWRGNSWGYLSEKSILLPTVLKSKGYHTAIIGKWHLGLDGQNLPNNRGFDLFKGFLGDMMDDYWTHLRGGKNWMRHNNEVIEAKGHATDVFTHWSIEYLKEQKETGNPFFLYLAYNAPHSPIQPPEEWLVKVKKREKNITGKRAKLVAFIEHLDYNIGEVMKALNETGLINNTLVVFTSDNGGSLYHGASNGILRGGKQDMYEGGIRVPMACQWNGIIKPGTQTNNFAMLMDLYPTFCDIAGIQVYHPIDGISILPTMLGQKQITDDRTVFWVRREGGKKYGGNAYYAARKGKYKLVQNTPYEPLQFFNLEVDETEQNPLDEKTEKAYKALRKELQWHIRRSGAIPWQKYE